MRFFRRNNNSNSNSTSPPRVARMRREVSNRHLQEPLFWNNNDNNDNDSCHNDNLDLDSHDDMDDNNNVVNLDFLDLWDTSAHRDLWVSLLDDYDDYGDYDDDDNDNHHRRHRRRRHHSHRSVFRPFITNGLPVVPEPTTTTTNTTRTGEPSLWFGPSYCGSCGSCCCQSSCCCPTTAVEPTTTSTTAPQPQQRLQECPVRLLFPRIATVTVPPHFYQNNNNNNTHQYNNNNDSLSSWMMTGARSTEFSVVSTAAVAGGRPSTYQSQEFTMVAHDCLHAVDALRTQLLATHKTWQIEHAHKARQLVQACDTAAQLLGQLQSHRRAWEVYDRARDEYETLVFTTLPELHQRTTEAVTNRNEVSHHMTQLQEQITLVQEQISLLEEKRRRAKFELRQRQKQQQQAQQQAINNNNNKKRQGSASASETTTTTTTTTTEETRDLLSSQEQQQQQQQEDDNNNNQAEDPTTSFHDDDSDDSDDDDSVGGELRADNDEWIRLKQVRLPWLQQSLQQAREDLRLIDHARDDLQKATAREAELRDLVLHQQPKPLVWNNNNDNNANTTNTTETNGNSTTSKSQPNNHNSSSSSIALQQQQQQPTVPEYKTEADCITKLEQHWESLLELHPRVFGYLLRHKSHNYTNHEADWDEFLQQYQNQQCPCGQPLEAHQILLAACPEESQRMEDRLRRMIQHNTSSEHQHNHNHSGHVLGLHITTSTSEEEEEYNDDDNDSQDELASDDQEPPPTTTTTTTTSATPPVV